MGRELQPVIAPLRTPLHMNMKYTLLIVRGNSNSRDKNLKIKIFFNL
jgi:hypothetical protein